MKRYRKTALAAISLLVVIVGLRLLANNLPMKLQGPEWLSLQECAEHQKNLYQSIEWYQQEYGVLPDPDFQLNGWPARYTWKCPATGRYYTLHLENYGNPDAVVIADERHKHQTTFLWWFKGLHPRVQTMGDGTIELFKDGKVLTMVGSKKRR